MTLLRTSLEKNWSNLKGFPTSHHQRTRPAPSAHAHPYLQGIRASHQRFSFLWINNCSPSYWIFPSSTFYWVSLPWKNVKILCSLQHYLQWTRQRNNWSVHWQMNGERKCGVCKRWDQKEGNPDVCDHMDGSWGPHAKRSKSDKERQILYYLTCGI